MAKGSLKKQRRFAQAQARKRAASQQVPAQCDLLILGAGASGLTCAIEAARTRPSQSIVLLEAKPSLGTTILATGNGRCNFCHEPLEPEAYNHPLWMEEFFSAVTSLWPGRTPSQLVQEFFGQLGLVATAHEGRLYPRSQVAASVRDLLLKALTSLPINAATLRFAVSLVPAEDGYEVSYQECFREDESAEGGWALRSIHARQVVVACGGGTQKALEPLGLAQVACEPVLCPVEVESDLFDALDGHRAQCELILDRTSYRERGEVLFRSGQIPHRGVLSGIVAYNFSRLVSPGDQITLNLAPDADPGLLEALAFQGGSYDPRNFDGLLDPAIASTLLPAASEDPKAAAEALARICGTSFPVCGKAYIQSAQVNRGGVSLEAVSLPSLECKAYPGLYILGEALDIDGACGGYNLGFAWLSGLLCAKSLASCP